VRVLFIAPGCDPTELRVDAAPVRLDAMQALVGGPIDRVVLSGTHTTGGLDLWVHDEGLLLGLPPNLCFKRDPSHPPLVGNAFITRYTPDGETKSLSDEDLITARALLDEHFTRAEMRVDPAFR
jgi:hypothetical protein